MTVNRFLIVLSVVLFLVALLCVVFKLGHDPRLVDGLTLGGLASFAGAHAT